ncbi:MAG: NAD(P)/FAD-dependent oxidoreductase [Candidatus Thorarchaeota archaeon]
MYDAAIIGAGPAGATCARYLGRLGYSVVLIDKATFPRDKPCGGGFSRSIIDEFPYLRSREDEFIDAVCKIGVLHSPNHRIELRSRIDMVVTLRTMFDNVLYENAIEQSSVVPMTGVRTKAVRLGDDHATVQLSDGRSIQARAVVGADGVGSIVARDAGLHRRWPSNKITACRVAEIPVSEDYVENVYGEDREYHFFANFGGRPGYAWIFPKKRTVNVGIGIVGRLAAGLPHRFAEFITYLKRQHLIPRESDLSRTRGALVPTGGAIRKTYTRCCILAGDAAGMVNPITGGGIHYAMVAGRYAALVLSQALEDNDLEEERLQKYQHLWWNDFGHDLPRLVIAQRLFTSSTSPVLFEIGSRDSGIQHMVSEAMGEHSGAQIDAVSLLTRVTWVCLREALTGRWHPT